MDALALLCTLHADGPVTLRSLHRAGCSSLQGVETYSAEELGGVLEVAPAVARRLLREARLLRERLDGGLLEREETPPATGVSTHGTPPPAPAAPADSLDSSDRKVLGEVLERWRRQDEVEPAPAAPAPVLEEPAAACTRLEAGTVDGLDGPFVTALERAGIATLDALVDADALTLASTIGRPFAHVRRVQFLAARALPESGAAGAASATLVPPARPDPDAEPTRAPEPPREQSSEKPVLNWNFDEPDPPADDPSGPFA